MSLLRTEIDAAENEADAARQRLAATMVELQQRLNPKTLAREAAHELKEAGEEFARTSLDSLIEHRTQIAGGAAAVALLMGRKTLAGWLHSLGGRDETSADSGSSEDKTPPPKPKRRHKEDK